MSREDDLYDEEEGVRPSSLRAVHKLSTPDSACDQQLAYDVTLINKRTVAELGPLPPGGMPVVPKRKPKRSHSVPLETTEDPVVAQSLKENDTMKLRNMAMASAVTIAAATAAASADAPRIEGKLPENIASFVGENKALLAYKAVDDGNMGKTVALILRDPKDPDPGLGKGANARVSYTCELILLHEKNGDLRVTGRSNAAVDCEYNHINRTANHLELNGLVELSPNTVRFRNDNIRGGSYTYVFAMDDGRWHLSGATSIYTTFEDGVDEVIIAEEAITYPKDIGFIPMESFANRDISDALAKNVTLSR